MESVQPVRLAYNTHEPSTGADENLAPIIYLHGLSALKEYWEEIPQKVANATKRRSYSLDARNHGESEWSDIFNFDVNVVDLIHFLDTMGIRKVVLVGHSMGGITAIKTALKMPDRVESIVVEDMTVRRITKQMTDLIFSYFQLLTQAIKQIPPGLNEAEARKSLYEFIVANISPETAKHVKRGGDDFKVDFNFSFLRQDAEGRYHIKCNADVIFKSISNYESLSSEPEGVFDGPALFIYGTLSPFGVGKDEECIKQFFPKAVLEGVEADHSIHIPFAEKFTELLLKFLS